jgi:hypothetical protein
MRLAVPSAAALPPPVRCEKSMLASPIPQTWYAYLITLPHLGIAGSRYYFIRQLIVNLSVFIATYEGIGILSPHRVVSQRR